ncbi:reticulocyte-binding protein 2-like [Clytia hemisphaerica]|uniref:reticulocyte-binding protein 2-like n=1 Tax=Clytia hemisphaerica TaxID=252671 RepID=UPI0034D665D9
MNKIKFKDKLTKLKSERDCLSIKLQNKINKLGKICTRNVTKRINTQLNNVKKLTGQLEEKENTLDSDVNDNLTKELDRVLKKNSKYRNKIRVLKNQIKNDKDQNEEHGYSESYVNELRKAIEDHKSAIESLENEKFELEEKINDFLEEKQVKVFRNGQYSQEIRMVYEDLLMLGISTANVQHAVRTVLKQLAGLEIDRLPKATFAKYMLLEARGLAHIHVASVLADEPSNCNTMQSDGTSKKGRTFMTYDMSTSSGKSMILGLRESGGGDASTQLKIFQEVVDDLSKTTSDDSFFNKTMASLADQADASLKVYEKIGYGTESNSPLNNGFPTSESGTTRTMLDLFTRCCDNSDEFLKGQDCLFPDLVHKDEIYSQLLQPWEHDSSMVKPLLELIFSGFITVTNRMLFDHLEGEFKNPSDSLISEASSAPTTNVSAERDFGMLDRLLKLKPKALDLSIEGIIMFNTNKTKEWRNSLSKEKLSEVMEAARKSKEKQKKLYHKRKEIIFEQRATKLANEYEERKQKEVNLVLEKERLAIEIESHGGLWSNEEKVSSALESMNTIKEKREAIKCQLDFRRKVLGINCDKSLFHMSTGGKLKAITELQQNLVEVINWKEPEISTTEESTYDFSKPVNIDFNLINEAKKKNLVEANETTQKLLDRGGKKGSKKKSVSSKKTKEVPMTKVPSKRANSNKDVWKVKKTKYPKTSTNTPIVSSPSDLVGKLVRHFVDRGNGEDWYMGVVLEISRGSKQNPKYKIQYTTDDEEGLDISFGNLFFDFKQENLELFEVAPKDFIDATISHMYEDEETGQEKWWTAKVADVDIDSENKDSPAFFLYFKEDMLNVDEGDEVIMEPEYFLEPLIENYLNGSVRFLDCPAS